MPIKETLDLPPSFIGEQALPPLFQIRVWISLSHAKSKRFGIKRWITRYKVSPEAYYYELDGYGIKFMRLILRLGKVLCAGQHCGQNASSTVSSIDFQRRFLMTDLSQNQPAPWRNW